MGALETYLQLTQQPQGGQQPQQQQMPQIDPNNALQSLAQLMGPTPAEREAQERKLLENKRKMIAWTGLFDGLRQLGNLYYATKGATPQQYTDKPYQTIEQNYMQERQLQDYLNRYSQAYAKQLFDFQRQADQDVMRKEAHQAQMKWYDTRDEMARLKEERDRLKNEKYIELQDGRIAKINAETGQIEALTPYKVDTEKSKAQKNRQQGNAAVMRANNSGKSGDSSKKNKNAKSGKSSNQNSTQKISTGVNWKKKQ